MKYVAITQERMKSFDSLRKIDSTLKDMNDDQLIEVRLCLYELSQLIFEDWMEQQRSSKSPAGSLTN